MSNLCVKNGNITTNYIDITQSGNDFNSGVPTASFHPHTNILLSSKHSARAERFQCFFRVFRFLICMIIYRFFTYRFTTTKRILLTRDYQETRFSIELKQTTARFCVVLTIPSVRNRSKLPRTCSSLLQTDVATLQAVSSGDVDGDAGTDAIDRRTGTTVALLLQLLLLLMMIVTDADAGLVEKLLQRVTAAATVGDVGSAHSASTARC